MLTVAAWSEGFTITPTIQPMSQGHLCRLLLFAAKRCKLWVVFVKCEKKWFGEAMTCKCQYFNYDSLLSIWLLLLMTPSLSRSLSLSLALSGFGWLFQSHCFLFGHLGTPQKFLASKPLSTLIGKTGANLRKSNDNHIETMAFPSLCPSKDFLLHALCRSSVGPLDHFFMFAPPICRALTPRTGHLWSHLIIVIVMFHNGGMKTALDVLFCLSSGTGDLQN